MDHGLDERARLPEERVAMIECHVVFAYWNPLKRRTQALPDGVEVRAVDADPISRDDVLGSGRIAGGKGEVRIEVDPQAGGEAGVELYFEILFGGGRVDLETGALVDAGGSGTSAAT